MADNAAFYVTYLKDIYTQRYSAKKKHIKIAIENSYREEYGIPKGYRLSEEIAEEVSRKFKSKVKKISKENLIQAIIEEFQVKIKGYDISYEINGDADPIFTVTPKLSAEEKAKREKKSKKDGDAVKNKTDNIFKLGKTPEARIKKQVDAAIQLRDHPTPEQVAIQKKKAEIIDKRNKNVPVAKGSKVKVPEFSDEQHHKFLVDTENVYSMSTHGNKVRTNIYDINNNIASINYSIAHTKEVVKNLEKLNALIKENAPDIFTEVSNKMLMEGLGLDDSESVEDTTDNLIGITEEGWNKIWQEYEDYKAKITKDFKTFCKVYIDDEGRHVFQEKLVYIYFADDKVDNGLSGQEKADMTAANFDVLSTQMEIAGMLPTAKINETGKKAEEIQARLNAESRDMILSVQEEIARNWDTIKRIKVNDDNKKVVIARDDEAWNVFDVIYEVCNRSIDKIVDYYKNIKPNVIKEERKKTVTADIASMKEGKVLKLTTERKYKNLNLTGPERKLLFDMAEDPYNSAFLKKKISENQKAIDHICKVNDIYSIDELLSQLQTTKGYTYAFPSKLNLTKEDTILLNRLTDPQFEDIYKDKIKKENVKELVEICKRNNFNTYQQLLEQYSIVKKEQYESRANSEYIKGLEKLVRDSGRTLREGINKEVKRAGVLFQQKIKEMNADSQMQLRLNMPTMYIEDLCINVVDSVDKEIKRMNKRSQKRTVIQPKSGMIARNFTEFSTMESENIGGFENIFFTPKISLKEQKILEKNNLDIFSYSMGFETKTRVVRKSSLRPMVIPKWVLKKKRQWDWYGPYMVASFFQILVSNTPIDEVYWYKEKQRYYTKGKYKTTESYSEEIIKTDKLGREKREIIKIADKVERDAEDIAQDMFEGKQLHVYEYARLHEPDEDVVRENWVVSYKGVNFSPIDPEFDESLFEKKSDLNSIALIAAIIKERTANSKIKSMSFSYWNNNKRWEQLEYGGYYDDSGPWKGISRYGFEHGVTNHFTHQAPHGFLRLVEAQWNALAEDGFQLKNLNYFLDAEGFDVTTASRELIDELKKYDPSLGSHEYDTQNFVVLMEDE